MSGITDYYDITFMFLGETITMRNIVEWEKVKTYKESSHLDRLLVKDTKSGRLYLYEFYEYVNFNGGADEIHETWVVVVNEAEADKIAEDGNLLNCGNAYFRVHDNKVMTCGGVTPKNKPIEIDKDKYDVE